jgi:hypothetical protein
MGILIFLAYKNKNYDMESLKLAQKIVKLMGATQAPDCKSQP